MSEFDIANLRFITCLCGLPISKNEETAEDRARCNWIKCPLCETEWCWSCGKTKGCDKMQCPYGSACHSH